jgi:hypothetical protein
MYGPQEMECVLRDINATLPSVASSDAITMVRINPMFPQNPGWEKQTVSIRVGALEGLRGIEAALLSMDELN